ncbi:putative membrane protein YhhN [Paenibacillus taihuensis]|uniref:Putative membrane protein YhhN n=1 Tax=Paenibacillus taihuensis TaxID=1156355 RepID=A0A3D9QV45_9BACL|nr:lysoplasmalogenase [Paenibacillus taihuensis]REE68120.1 putative membrane protein YhhN [Paenibacillus taihuensis]
MFRKLLPYAIALMSALYIFVIPAEPEGLKLVFKLIPMALILTYAWLLAPTSRQSKHWLLLLGLFFSMCGDGLMKWFVAGLSAFLIGHLFYIASFTRELRFSWPRAATLLPIALYAGYMGYRLVNALQDSGDNGLLAPVLVYITVISLMAWTAILTGNRFAIIGSLLFLASDSILSWNMFVSDISYSGVWIMTTYYVAQFFIASSIRARES